MNRYPHSLGLFLPSLAGGGAERVLVDLANHWAAEGRDVRLICGAARGPYREQIDSGVRICDLGAERMALAVLPLRALLRRAPTLPLLSSMSHANAAVLLAGRVLGRHHGTIVVQEASRFELGRHGGTAAGRGLTRALVGRLYPLADHVTAVSEDVAEELAKLIGWPVERISVIPNPIRLPLIQEKARAPCPHPWLADGKSKIILGVGRLSPEKDFATLISALALVREKTPARLLILGEGPLEHELRRFAVERNLDSVVDFVGFQANPLAFMSRADLVAVSSVAESFALVLVEAMAVGTNVVCVDCGAGPRTILADPVFGTLPKPGDCATLARAILARLSAPLPPARLQALAAKFDIDPIAKQLLTLLSSGERT